MAEKTAALMVSSMVLPMVACLVCNVAMQMVALKVVQKGDKSVANLADRWVYGLVDSLATMLDKTSAVKWDNR